MSLPSLDVALSMSRERTHILAAEAGEMAAKAMVDEVIEVVLADVSREQGISCPAH